MNITTSNSSLSDLYNFTTPIWSEACGGFDIIERNFTIEINNTLNTTTPSGILALNSEVWKNCSCTWPLDTADRTFECCVLNWFEIINKQNPNDWESLAVQYITATLNLLNGVEPDDDSLYTDLNATHDILDVCPGNWTRDETYRAQELKARLEEFNHDGNWSTPMVNRISVSNEDKRQIISTTETPKNSHFLLFLIPTVLSVAVVVLAGTLVFYFIIKDKPGQKTETANII
jgi:hypothetical protein